MLKNYSLAHKRSLKETYADNGNTQTHSQKSKLYRGLSLTEQVPLTGNKEPPSFLGFKRTFNTPAKKN